MIEVTYIAREIQYKIIFQLIDQISNKLKLENIFRNPFLHI